VVTTVRKDRRSAGRRAMPVDRRRRVSARIWTQFSDPWRRGEPASARGARIWGAAVAERDIGYILSPTQAGV
jgi:hypothetical protein